MALFGKKSNDATTATAAAPSADAGKKRGLSLGRKKDNAAAAPAPAAAGAEDFSDFGVGTAVAEPVAAPAAKGRRRKRGGARPTAKKLKSGTVVGLNIGNDSIKAIELRIKGDAITVTAMGMVPTPTESISNGVVMSVSALAQALRELFKQSGISSRAVVSSVSGTGSLVVRVIEVPQMTDHELAENMKVDADRYIPFPPSEVVMDFRALRNLPTDPNSGNMEVLLAAAQREIIDLHINVLQAAKLTPQSIDVEPLAVARTLLQSGEVGAADGYLDYNNVSAIMNIGASSTEISVLRGDILVFTRSVPVGGNALTQHIVDNLGLPWHDAERLKRDWGDALPPHPTGQAVTGGAYAAPSGDWNEFSDFTATPATDFDTDDAAVPAAPTAAPPAAAPPAAPAPAATGTTDPFDLDFFNQGPANNDPSEQHGQKQDPDEDEKPVPSFDFSNFNFENEASATAPATPAPATPPVAAAAPVPPSTAPAPSAPAAAAAEPAGSGFNFAFPEEHEVAPAPPPGAFNFNMDDLPEPAPSAATAETIQAAAAEPAPEPVSTQIAGSGLDVTAASAAPAMPDAALTTMHQAAPSAYDMGAATPAATPAAPATVAAPAAPVAGAADDFDIDSLFAAAPATMHAAPAPFDLGGASAAAPAADYGADFEQFGAGFGGADTTMTGIQPETVHSVIRPLLEELAGETRRSLEYYASRYPDTVIRRVTLVGGGAKLKNIDAFLTQMLGIPATVGNPLARMTVRAPKLPPEYADQNGPFFAVAVGLALRDVV